MKKCYSFLAISIIASALLGSGCDPSGDPDGNLSGTGLGLPEFTVSRPASLGEYRADIGASYADRAIASESTLGDWHFYIDLQSFLSSIDEDASPDLREYARIRSFLEQNEAIDPAALHECPGYPALRFKIMEYEGETVTRLAFVAAYDAPKAGYIAVSIVGGGVPSVTIASFALSQSGGAPESSRLMVYDSGVERLRIAEFSETAEQSSPTYYQELFRDSDASFKGLMYMPEGMAWNGIPTASSTVLTADADYAGVYHFLYDDARNYYRVFELLNATGATLYSKQGYEAEAPYYLAPEVTVAELRSIPAFSSDHPEWFVTKTDEGVTSCSIDGVQWQAAPTGSMYGWRQTEGAWSNGDYAYRLIDELEHEGTALKVYYAFTHHDEATFWDGDADAEDYTVYHMGSLYGGSPFDSPGFALCYDGLITGRRWWFENTQTTEGNPPDSFTPFVDLPLGNISEVDSSEFVDGLPRAYSSSTNVRVIPEWLSIDEEAIDRYESGTKLLSETWQAVFDIDGFDAPVFIEADFADLLDD